MKLLPAFLLSHSRGAVHRRGFRNSRNFRTPITNRATPKLVVHGERPTTDFLGTGAGPMAFAPRRERVVGRGQPAELPARSRGSCSKAIERAHFVMLYFGLFVRNEVNPE